MYNSTVIKTQHEVFQLSWGKLYFNKDYLLNEWESNLILKKLISYQNSCKLLLPILFGSFQDRFLGQFHVEFSIKKISLNY